ncbi:dentin sialophosphoprotein-like [Mya arenaria]|uniref:dentin sialophosphoprotein-like n=1 Tax=Mya arenaria TaxID=6604 RepID=UPI0022E70C4C|nr:dentin sialophosphoprotein-like [Mya arenaria]
MDADGQTTGSMKTDEEKSLQTGANNVGEPESTEIKTDDEKLGADETGDTIQPTTDSENNVCETDDNKIAASSEPTSDSKTEDTSNMDNTQESVRNEPDGCDDKQDENDMLDQRGLTGENANTDEAQKQGDNNVADGASLGPEEEEEPVYTPPQSSSSTRSSRGRQSRADDDMDTGEELKITVVFVSILKPVLLGVDRVTFISALNELSSLNQTENTRFIL